MDQCSGESGHFPIMSPMSDMLCWTVPVSLDVQREAGWVRWARLGGSALFPAKVRCEMITETSQLSTLVSDT